MYRDALLAFVLGMIFPALPIVNTGQNASVITVDTSRLGNTYGTTFSLRQSKTLKDAHAIRANGWMP